MTGEIILGRGDYDISIATGRPPARVAVTTRDAVPVAIAEGESDASPVLLEAPRILDDGFAFRATVAGPSCRIFYQYNS
jgi:hypothetical protein